MSKFAELAKKHRMAHHETQQQYAERFGFDTATAVSLWESGQRKVPENVIEAIVLGELPKYEICENCKVAGIVRQSILKPAGEGA